MRWIGFLVGVFVTVAVVADPVNDTVPLYGTTEQDWNAKGVAAPNNPVGRDGRRVVLPTQQDNQGKNAPQAKYDATFKICQAVAPVGGQGFPVANSIDPLAAAQSYFHTRGADLNIYRDPGLGLPPESFKEIMLMGPLHGRLRNNIYYPDKGYLGADQMTFSVAVNGKMFKVIYSVDVVHAPDYGSSGCPDGFEIMEITDSAGPKG